MSGPRRKADALEALGTMPDDAKERLRKSQQSSLRHSLPRLLTGLDRSEVGTTQLLAVPLVQLRNLVPVSRTEGLACAGQWTALLEALGGRKASSSKCQSGTLQYEPNLRVQALSTVVHRPAESVLLRCTACSHALPSSWSLVVPQAPQTSLLFSKRGEARVYPGHVCES